MLDFSSLKYPPLDEEETMTENKIGPFYFSREEATYLIDGLLCVENNGYSFGSSDDDIAARNLILRIAEKDNDLAVKYRYDHQELFDRSMKEIEIDPE